MGESGRGFGLEVMRKLKLKKKKKKTKKKRKLLNQFLYSNSYHFLNIIIIIFLLPTIIVYD